MKIQWKVSAVLCLVFVLSLASIAQTAAAPASTPLTPEERELALKNLQATHDAFLKSIAGLSEKQWRFKPAPDRWSIAEVAEHITVAESTIFGLVENKMMMSPATPDKRSETQGKDELILQRVP